LTNSIGRKARKRSTNIASPQLLGLGVERRREGDPLDFRYRTAAECFRIIEDDQDTLVVPYDGAARAAIATLRRDGADRHLLRRLQPFTVPVVRDAMSKLREALAVEDLDGITVLTKEDLYRPDVGLDLDLLGGPAIGGFDRVTGGNIV